MDFLLAAFAGASLVFDDLLGVLVDDWVVGPLLAQVLILEILVLVHLALDISRHDPIRSEVPSTPFSLKALIIHERRPFLIETFIS